MTKVNMRSKNRISWQAGIVTALLAALISMPFFTDSVKADGIPVLTRTAALTSPSGGPDGNAAWELFQGGNLELEVEIENVNLAQGTILNAFVDGNLVGPLTVDSGQRARLRLRTENGQTVPPVNDGSTVDVRNGSTVLANGIFGRGSPTPTATPTGSPTGTPSPSPSGTPSHTPTPSPSGTPSHTPTPSPSGTPTATPSPSPTGAPMIIRTAILRPPTGSSDPHGNATWEQDQSGNREIEVEIEDVNLPAGTSVNAIVDGNVIGQMVLDSNGRGRLSLRTENGQAVPLVNDGSTIEVRNGATALASGVFGPEGTTPSPTVTPTGTPSPSPSGSPTGTPSPSPSGTPTGTPTGTPSPSPTETPDDGHLFASLTGPVLNGVVPTGYAQFETEGSRAELEVRVRQVNLAIGTSLDVVVDGTTVGTMLVKSGGEARLELRSDNGQTVPVIVVGSTIAIKNGEAVILSGTFTGFGIPTPSPTGTPGSTPSPTPFGRSFESHLSGSQMTPPVVTEGTAEVKVLLSSDGTQATVFGEFHHLSSNESGALIQSTVAGITTTIRDLGVVGGINGHLTATTFAVSAAQAQQLRSGLWSAVIMSENNPAGEIRGLFRGHSSESDFDGDGQHDFAVFRPSTGMWYTENTNGFSAQSFGLPTDRVVSGDYDGDGRTDAAVYRNINGAGVWAINRSSDGGTTTVAWGLPSDIPVRGDFDGDGRLDLAVYRPSDGVWYIKPSDNTANRAIHFGVAEDIPVPADMDGDGKDDLVVFRPSTGTWYWLRSSDGQFAAANFGLSGDIPVRGDFDGDGKADITVFRPSDGTWYTLRSSDGQFQATRFGLAGDIPVAGNYDADGITDIAVFRPSDGNWYVLRSSDGVFQAYHFGLAGDIPAIAR